MIWDPNTTSEPDDSAIVSYITAGITMVCGENVPVDSCTIKELARAVESFLQQECDCSFADSKYLVMLASHALSSIGERHVARRLLVFGTGLVRPAQWEVTGEEAIWVLDLKQMTVRDDGFLELVFFNSLNIILESIADVWDESSGQGVLGLRHVYSTSLALLGCSRKKREAMALAEEIKTLCSGKLGEIRDERGWKDSPLVMNLDI